MQLTEKRKGQLPAEVQYQQNTGVQQIQLLWHYINHTLPRVKQHLDYWRHQALQCIDYELREQALASLAGKDFHCQGGAVLAAPYPDWEDSLIEFIVAYQTLCDYLDNLCDRTNCFDGLSFRQLHQSLLDALALEHKTHDYYKSYPYQADAGYIDKLVQHCWDRLVSLPSYAMVRTDVLNLAQMYIELQVKKHIAWEQREKTLISWADSQADFYPGLRWNEFAAASGSTLAIFALLGLATRQEVSRSEVQSTLAVYFPWICGLHILLDYFIDQEEDRIGGDLNFTYYYRDRKELMERLAIFIRQAHLHSAKLSDPAITRTVVEGLLAMYFSDSKVKAQGISKECSNLIRESGNGAVLTYYLCAIVRKFI